MGAISNPALDPVVRLERYGVDACDLDSRVEVRKLLHEATKVEPRHPAVLAVTAALARVDGEIPRAIRLYRDALGQAPSSALRAAVLEDLIALESARYELQTSPTDTALAMALADHPQHVGLRSIRAMLLAMSGDASAADDIDGVAERALVLHEIPRARALHRIGIAAYYLRQYAAACRFWLEAADVAQRAGAHRIAARAFFQLHVHALTVHADAATALLYASQAAVAASIAEDRDLKQLALGTQYTLEVECGNKLRAADLQAMLRRDPHVPGYVAFPIAMADTLLAAWNDNWVAARASILSARPSAEEPAAVAMYNGILSLVELASENNGAALKAAGVAAHHSRPARGDTAYALRARQLGRILAAGTLLFAGQAQKAGRLLATRQFRDGAPAPVHELARVIEGSNVSPLRDRAPDMLGYGLLLAAVRRKLHHDGGNALLTRAEIQLLMLRSQGVAAAEIARQERVTRDAIMKRQQRAVEKLGAPNIIAAISEARRRGLLA